MRKTKVFGLQSTKEVRDQLIDLLTERMRHHKDKFISPTIYHELRGLEVKKNGKVEHSDLTHDDQIFSFLMAMYVWYEGKNLRENFGIEKFGIKTEESVDDVVDLTGSEDFGDITEQIAYVNRDDQDKFESQVMELQKAKGMMLSEFVAKQQKAEQEQLRIMLQNPAIKQAYANKFNIPVDAVSTENMEEGLGNESKLPDSLFTDFNKDESQFDRNSVYRTMGHSGYHPLQGFGEDDSLQ